MNFYLFFNAGIYLLLAIWCIALPDKTSTAVGFQLIAGSGRSEYLAVYGGLQIGLAIFYALCALKPELRLFGIIFSCCLYVPLFSCRVISLLRFEQIGHVTYITAALELVLTSWALYLVRQ